MIWLLAPQFAVDWCIHGEGFFRLLDAEKPSYSKQGHFVVAGDGLLRSKLGPALDPPVRVPRDATGFVVEADGTIFALVPNGRREVGCLSLARFPQGRQAPVLGTPGSDGFGTVNDLATGKLRIAIAPTVEATGPDILLGEIASVEGDGTLATRVRELSIGSSPLAGGSRTLTRSQVITKVRGAKIEPGQFDLDMPDTITVSRPAQEVPEERIVEAARGALEAPDTMEAAQGPKSIRVPAGEYELQPGQAARSGTGWSVPVDILVAGKQSARVTIHFSPARDAKSAEGGVKPGDEVTVRIESGALVIETTGVVRQKGAVGSQVSVYVPSTHKTVRAEVVNSSTVKVMP